MASSSDQVRVAASDMHSFSTSLFVNAGVSPEHAKVVSDALVLADLRGVDTHGINRIPAYLTRVKGGVLNPKPELNFVNRTPVMAQLDAQGTFGFLAGSLAIQKAAEMANIYGVGIVGVKNSGHFGMAATYLLKAIEQGLAAMVFTNASRSMPAWGSKEALLGTSPFAVGLPGRNGDHWTLDMSPSVVARVSATYDHREQYGTDADDRARFAKLYGEARRFRKVGLSMLKGAILQTQKLPWEGLSYPLEVPKGLVLP